MRDVVAVLIGILLRLGNVGIALALRESHQREVFIDGHAVLQKFRKFFHGRQEARIQVNAFKVRHPDLQLEFGIAESGAVRKDVRLERRILFERGHQVLGVERSGPRLEVQDFDTIAVDLQKLLVDFVDLLTQYVTDTAFIAVVKEK